MKDIDFANVGISDCRSTILKMNEKAKQMVYDNIFNPPTSLGKPKDKRTKEYKEVMAMDSCCRNVLSGFKNVFDFSSMPMFVGYPLLSNLSQEALIRAGVETIADSMTRKFIEWTYDDDDNKDDTEKTKLIAEMETQSAKYKLKEVFNEAMLKDGYFGGCLVYIDMGELSDEEKQEPLVLDKRSFQKGKFKGFKVVEPINVYPGEYNTSDPLDDHYFNPEFWYVMGVKYHASRFLYFASNKAPILLKPAYNFFGIPQAQLALDYVAHFVANREAAQKLLNKFSLMCWGTNMSQVLQGKDCNGLVNRVKFFNRMRDNDGTALYDKETEELSQINTPLSGVKDLVSMSLSLLTAIWRIPKIVYIGEGEGGLNASSKEQLRCFYDYIMALKENNFTNPLEVVMKIFQLNLGYDINEALGFKFPVMWDMDDKERADLNKQQADRDAIYLANGVLSQEEVRRRLSMDKNSEYSMIDVDDVPEPQEQPLDDVDKEEQDEEVKAANDVAMDEEHWRYINGNRVLIPNNEPQIYNEENVNKYLRDIELTTSGDILGELPDKNEAIKEINKEIMPKDVKELEEKLSRVEIEHGTLQSKTEFCAELKKYREDRIRDLIRQKSEENKGRVKKLLKNVIKKIIP